MQPAQDSDFVRVQGLKLVPGVMSAPGRSSPLRVHYRESEGPRLPGVDWGVEERKGTADTGARSARIVKHMPASQSLQG